MTPMDALLAVSRRKRRSIVKLRDGELILFVCLDFLTVVYCRSAGICQAKWGE